MKLAIGATAAQSVFGRITTINKTRGRIIDLADGVKALVTVHPSYLPRLPDAVAKAREYERCRRPENRGGGDEIRPRRLAAARRPVQSPAMSV